MIELNVLLASIQKSEKLGNIMITCTLQVGISNNIWSKLYTWQIFAVLL
jgi:hypothetical protein